jgi:hypothetical protein
MTQQSLVQPKNPGNIPRLQVTPTNPSVGDKVTIEILNPGNLDLVHLDIKGDQHAVAGVFAPPMSGRIFNYSWDTTGVPQDDYLITATVADPNNHQHDRHTMTATVSVLAAPLPAPPTEVQLTRTATYTTPELPLWVLIRRSTNALSFNNYFRAMELLLCGLDPTLDNKQLLRADFHELLKRRSLPFNDTDAYRILKVATESFVMVNCPVANPRLADVQFTDRDAQYLLNFVDVPGTMNGGVLKALLQQYLQPVLTGDRGGNAVVQTLMYLQIIRDKLPELRLKSSIFHHMKLPPDLPETCFGILKEKLTSPCMLELVWSYWHEEGMLNQTANAVALRFQNIRSGRGDPLAFMEIDPLRPLNNLMWGYIQDEQHRLTLVRRAYEYSHHYGLPLQGKAVPQLQPADNRSKFLEAFHNLLYQAAIFYKEDDDTTVRADGFPMLNALKDVHILLTEGMHNQFGDLPSTARQEMLLQQWILARPEFREFLPTRIMVDYPEPWMDRVDAMKHIQGWSDVSVLHFHNLGVFGEQVLLSIRFHPWSGENDPTVAANWGRYWRAEIQGYIHAYRAVTGVDVTAEVTNPQQAALRNLPPSLHLARRLAAQRRSRPALAGNGRTLPSMNLSRRHPIG